MNQPRNADYETGAIRAFQVGICQYEMNTLLI